MKISARGTETRAGDEIGRERPTADGCPPSVPANENRQKGTRPFRRYVLSRADAAQRAKVEIILPMMATSDLPENSKRMRF